MELAQNQRPQAAAGGQPSASGCSPERRSSEMIEFSRWRGNEGYEACSDDATTWGHHLSAAL